MMDWKYLADKLFPHIVETPEQVEARYPKRNLPEGAKVTRIEHQPNRFHASRQPIRCARRRTSGTSVGRRILSAH